MVEANNNNSIDTNNLEVALVDSSVNYVILSYLTQLKVTQMQLVCKKFYNKYIPRALHDIAWERSSLGTIPTNQRNKKHVFIRGGSDQLTFLTLKRHDNNNENDDHK